MQGSVEVDSNKPLLAVELRCDIGVFKLIVAIPANNDEVFRMMPSSGIKMVNLEMWLLVPLEKPEVTYLTMPLIEVPQ